jgi:dihydroxy-acid dehydratase
VRIDLNARRVDVLLDDAELARRRAAHKPPELRSQTPWEQLFRAQVGQLSTGMCLEPATAFLRILETRGEPRHSH